MSKKITKEEFLRRFKIACPNEDIEVIDFTAMSHPTTVRCKKCGKIHTKSKANYFISNYQCCDAVKKTKFERVVEFFANNKDFQLIKKIDCDNIIIKHLVCGNEFKRNLQATVMSPEVCPHCQTNKYRNMLPLEEVQKRLDELFHNNILVLEYNGFEKKSLYRCQKCGLIFKQKFVCLQQSRGCPKCDKKRSNGERKMCEYLESKGILFKEQATVPELPGQRFDFCVYKDIGEEIFCYIEVNGEQHYEQRIFPEDLEKIQERDERKRRYCKEKNIPLYEIRWIKGKFLNLDILPF